MDGTKGNIFAAYCKKCLKIKVFAIECKNCAFYITLCYTNAEGGAMA